MSCRLQTDIQHAMRVTANDCERVRVRCVVCSVNHTVPVVMLVHVMHPATGRRGVKGHSPSRLECPLAPPFNYASDCLTARDVKRLEHIMDKRYINILYYYYYYFENGVNIKVHFSGDLCPVKRDSNIHTH